MSTLNTERILSLLPKPPPTYGNVLEKIQRLTKSALTPEEEVEDDAEYLKYEVSLKNLGKIKSVRPEGQIVLFHKVFAEFVVSKKRAIRLRQNAANEVHRANAMVWKGKLDDSLGGNTRFNRNRQGFGRRVQSKNQFERQSRNNSKPTCQECDMRHYPDESCKCRSCNYRHLKAEDCPICYNCNTRGHKAKHCHKFQHN